MLISKKFSRTILIILLFFLPLSAFAQIRDISVLAGVNVPMDRGVESDAVIAVNYGQFSHSGLGFRIGAQWSPSVADIDNSFGIPVAFAYRTRTRSTKGRLQSGVAGSSSTPSKSAWGDYWQHHATTWTEKGSAFSLSIDAGMCLNYSIWRFDIKLIPAFHYSLTDNYIYHKSMPEEGIREYSRPLGWFFTFSGGIAFRFE